MAQTVNAAFAQFLTDKVNLDPDRTKTARGSRDWLYGQIDSFKTDATFPVLWSEYNINYGSFARKTKVRPLDDISIRVINKFISKCGDVPQYAKADLKRNGAAAVLKLQSYEWTFDIVPCFMTSVEWNGRNYYLIPDGSGNWKKTDPRIDRARVKDLNQAHDGHVLNVLRIIKYWNRRPTMPSMSSYLLESMILDYYAAQTVKASEYVDIEIPK